MFASFVSFVRAVLLMSSSDINQVFQIRFDKQLVVDFELNSSRFKTTSTKIILVGVVFYGKF